jgi:hypothetical protein
MCPLLDKKCVETGCKWWITARSTCAVYSISLSMSESSDFVSEEFKKMKDKK